MKLDLFDMSDSSTSAPSPRPAPFVLDTQTPASVSLDSILAKRRAALAGGLARPLVGDAGEHGTPDMLDNTAGAMVLFSQPVKAPDPLPEPEPVFELVGVGAASDPERELRDIWTAQGVTMERQNALIEGIEAAAAPGAMVGPFCIGGDVPENVRHFPSVLAEVKEAGEDFEWYPTTSEIIHAVARAIPVWTEGAFGRSRKVCSVLDVGAGDGKVLKGIRDAWKLKGKEAAELDLYAIEKSSVLISKLDPCIYVAGTDFWSQSLYSKKVDVIFSNPPYSQFEEWSAKVIRESAAPLVLLVIPERWEGSEGIKMALEARGGKTKVLGSYDFENSEDRKARAKVHLVRVELDSDPDSAFEAFFNDQFGEYVDKHRAMLVEEAAEAQAAKDAAKESGSDPVLGGRHRPYHRLKVGADYPAALCALYREELATIQRNYEAISKLDPVLLREFAVDPPKIMKLLRERSTGLRVEYWKELFSHLKQITSRLTTASRNAMLETLNARVDVDFTEENIHAVLVWAIKNANDYIERQLLAVYERMIDKSCVVNYKSNQRVFVDSGWRYERETDTNSHFALDLRIVCSRVGGINTDRYAWHSFKDCGLQESCGEFLQDLITLANNLGFSCSDCPRSYEWKSGTSVTFQYTNKGKKYDLFNVRAFYNSNVHLKFSKAFILALNVEHGRLRGWIRSGKQAAEELREPLAEKFFKSTYQMLPGSGVALLS